MITALPLEFKAVCSFLNNLEEVEHPQGNIYTKGIFHGEKNTWDILVAQIGKTNPIAAQETERAIAFYQPSIALFIGIAAGIKDVKLGDIIAGDKIYYYESGKWSEDQSGRSKFNPRPLVYNSGYRLVEHAKALARKDDWQKLLYSSDLGPKPSVIVGPIAAGESVVASIASEIYALIHEGYGDSIGLDMEDFGFLRAAYANPDLQALIVRGVSDLIKDKDKTDLSGNPARTRRPPRRSQNYS